jgi:BA14K-like protein
MKQTVFFYCAFAVIVLGSVLFGLDWQPAALSPMRPIPVVPVVMPPPQPPAPAATPKSAAPVVAAVPQTLPNPVAPNLAAPKPAAPIPVAPVNPPVVQTLPPPKPLCDVAACAAAYRSFRESDCTFNPSFGPRQLCTKGVVPKDAASAAPASLDAPASIMQAEPGAKTNTAPAAAPNVKCSISACAAAYHTFTESDCTFMASGGQRKVCTK